MPAQKGRNPMQPLRQRIANETAFIRELRTPKSDDFDQAMEGTLAAVYQWLMDHADQAREVGRKELGNIYQILADAARR